MVEFQQQPLKVKLLRLLFIVVSVVTIVGCDAGFHEDPKDDEALRDANKIFSEYQKIQGFYKGTMELKINGDVSLVEIEVRLKPEVKYGETRKDGELIPQVDLSGTLEVRDFEWYYNRVTYQGRYWYAQDGRIEMAQVVSMGQRGNGLWFQAYPTKSKLQRGKIWDTSGLIGTFEADLVTREVRAPGEGNKEEERKRLEEAYKDLLGVYLGRVSNPNDPMDNRRSFPYRFHFYLQASQLYASLDRPDLEYDIPRVIKVVEFRPDTGYLELTGEAQPGRSNPGWGIFFARGRLQGEKLSFIEMSDHIGPLGTFEGRKIR